MSTITITDDVTYTDGGASPVTVVVSKDGCTVTHLSTTIFLSWVCVEDVSYLAEVFADTTVRAFAVIVPLLAKAHKLKDIVC
jgi:hypothetical protein